MGRKFFLSIVVLIAALSLLDLTRIHSVIAQESGLGGEAGVGGQAGLGGDAGAGGAGGAGGSGGGSSAGGGIAAYGEYVYVVNQGSLYQFAAYDLKLIKKVDLNRLQRGRRGGSGRDGESGVGGAGGRGGDAGSPGGVEDVAAFGEFIFVLRGGAINKLNAESLELVKSVTIK